METDNSISFVQFAAGLLVEDEAWRKRYYSACSIERATGDRKPLIAFMREYSKFLIDNSK